MVEIKRKFSLIFYGDDFTGSTDSMESLTLNGLKTILFVNTPDTEILDRFSDIDCIGISRQ